MRLKHTFIHGLLLAAILVIYPIILHAYSPTLPDTVQSDSRKMPCDLQVLSEMDYVKPGTHELNKEAMILLTQQNEAEVKEAHEAAPVEGTYLNEEADEDVQQIPDPMAPMNKVMFHFNDKLYFWALKPVTQVYSHTVPEDFRIVFSNAYDNLLAPVRMLNHLLQFRFKPAGNELIRFLFNSFAGVFGLADAARDALGIKKQGADFGQTLGYYGIGHGFYLVLPIFGPSSLRDGIGMAGDRLMYPLNYAGDSSLTANQLAGISAHEKINDASFRIGDYESFKESAIDPYVSMRDSFVQYRKKKVAESKR